MGSRLLPSMYFVADGIFLSDNRIGNFPFHTPKAWAEVSSNPSNHLGFPAFIERSYSGTLPEQVYSLKKQRAPAPNIHPNLSVWYFGCSAN